MESDTVNGDDLVGGDGDVVDQPPLNVEDGVDGANVDARLVAQLRWDEYKFRQQQFWSSYKWNSTAITILSIGPLLRPELESLRYFILLAPVSALLLTLVGFVQLGSEYVRLSAVRVLYEETLGEEFQRRKLKGLFAGPIGWRMVWLYLAVFSTLSLTSMGFLLFKAITQ